MGVGSAAEPEMLTRILSGETACRVASCISGSRERWVAKSRLYTVGTTVKNVTLGGGLDGVVLLVPLVGRKGVAKRRHTASALKGNMNSTAEPARRGAMMPLTTPWMW